MNLLENSISLCLGEQARKWHPFWHCLKCLFSFVNSFYCSQSVILFSECWLIIMFKDTHICIYDCCISLFCRSVNYILVTFVYMPWCFRVTFLLVLMIMSLLTSLYNLNFASFKMWWAYDMYIAAQRTTITLGKRVCLVVQKEAWSLAFPLVSSQWIYLLKP